MTILYAVLFGIVQGIGEILPLSASGHLLLPALVLPIDIDVDVLHSLLPALQTGTLLALIVTYRSTWSRLRPSVIRSHPATRRLFGLILLAILPTLLAALAYRPLLQRYEPDPLSLAWSFGVMGVFLLITEFFPAATALESLSVPRAFVIGIFQALSLIPGFSSIALATGSGRIMGLSRRDSFDFACLLLVPTLVASLVLSMRDATLDHATVTVPLVSASIIASFATSSLLLSLLRRTIGHIRLALFSFYLIPLALLLLAYHYHGQDLWDPHYIQQSVHRYGGYFIFAFALTEVIPPLSFFSPGVFTMITAGTLVSDISTGLVFFIAAVAGLTLGNTVLFLIGRRYGRDVAHYFYLTEKRLHTVDMFMSRFGRVSIFLGQFVGAVRPFAALIAGTTNMRRGLFFVAMFLGCAVWAGCLLAIGYFLRGHLHIILSLIGTATVIFVAGGAFFVVRAEKKLLRAAKKE